MPYPDSEYPSILRGKDKRESQRLLAAAPDLLAACRLLLFSGGDSRVCYCEDRERESIAGRTQCDECFAAAAIAKAEGRTDD